MVTLKSVNAALAAAGVAERLYRGQGYFYFADGETSRWRDTSVYVFRLNQLTLEQWLAEHKALSQSIRPFAGTT